MSDNRKRDKFGQYDKPLDEWTDDEWTLLAILEEVASPDENPDKTLTAYMADILDLLTEGVTDDR